MSPHPCKLCGAIIRAEFGGNRCRNSMACKRRASKLVAELHESRQTIAMLSGQLADKREIIRRLTA